MGPVGLGLYHPPHHQGREEGLHPEVAVDDGDVGEDHARQDAAGFLRLWAGLCPGGVHLPHLGTDVLQGLPLGEDLVGGALLEGGGQVGEYRVLAAHHLHNLLVRYHAHPFHRHDDGDVLREGVVLEVQLPVLHRQVGATLPLVGGAGHRATDDTLPVLFDDDAVLGELLLDEDHLLHSLDDEVAARVERALVQLGQFQVRLAGERAIGGPQHYGHASYGQALPDNPLGSTGVLDVHGDGGAVRDVPETTLVGGDLSRDVEGLLDVGHPHRDVEVLEVERRVCVARDHLVRPHDFFHVHVDEVVEGVDVLFNQAFHLQEGRNELPFLLDCVYRRSEVIVARIELPWDHVVPRNVTESNSSAPTLWFNLTFLFNRMRVCNTSTQAISL